MWLVVERGSGRLSCADTLAGLGSRSVGRDVRVYDVERAERALRDLARDPLAGDSLRHALRGLAGGSEIGKLTGREVVARLASLVRQQRLRVAELGLVHVSGVGGAGEGKDAAAQVKEALESITYQVVDDATGDPIAGVSLSVTLPNGKEVDQTTNGEGIVRFDDLKPGRCAVRAKMADRDLLHVLAYVGFGLHPLRTDEGAKTTKLWDRPTVHDLKPAEVRDAKSAPVHIVVVDEHKVATGETFDTIAEKHGTTAAKLKHFNFGTTDDKEVQRHLAREVGTTLRNLKTGEYAFSSQDVPGILYVPREWQVSGQVTDRDHVIRVRRIEPYQPPYVFSL
jgi:hypothetical protein